MNLSDQEQEALRNLWRSWQRRRSSKLRVPWNAQPSEASLDVLELAKSVEVVPDLLVMLRDGTFKSRQMIESLLCQHLVQLDVGSYFRVDEGIRDLSYDQTARTVVDFSKPWDGVIDCWIGMTHPVGMIRDQSLRKLGEIDSVLAVHLAFLRMNDWVDPIRELALKVVGDRFPGLSKMEKISCLPLIRILLGCGRHRFHEGLRSMAAVSVQSMSWEEWLATFQVSARLERRFLSAVLRESGQEIPLEVCLALVADQDRKSVIWLIENPESLASGVMEPLRDRLLKSKSGTIAAAYLRRLVEEGGEGLDLALRAGLFSPSKSVRGIARFYLKSMNEEVVVKIYLESLRNGNERPWIGLVGLGEVKPELAEKEAGEILLRGDEPVPMLKAALGVIKFGLRKEVDRKILEHLNHGEAGVRKSVMNCLVERGQLVTVEILVEYLDGLLDAGVVLEVMGLLLKPMDKWEYFRLFLMVSPADGEQILSDWEKKYGHYHFTKPGAAKYEEYLILLRESKLGPELKKRAGVILTRWK